MKYIFGVDGGGTGCRVGLADENGKIISRQNGGPANIETSFDEAKKNILLTCKKALRQINLPEHLINDSSAVLGLAGSNMGEFDRELSKRLPFKNNLIVNDGDITLQGAIGASDGCIAAIGTGSVFVGRKRGVINRTGGWGFNLGDDGSGAILGKNLLRLAIRCHEKLDAHSALTYQVMKKFDNKIINLVKETYNFKPKDYAQFAHLVFEFNTVGDVHAINILNEQLPVIEKSIIATGFNKNRPFCLLGGLGKFYKKLIQKHFSDAIVEPKGDAVEGALDIARTRLRQNIES